MDRTTFLWSLVVFFGASLAFRAVQQSTEHSSKLLTIGLELVVLLVLVGGISVYVRRKKP